MSADPVFLDTAALLALVHRRDSLHARAQVVMKELGSQRARLVTSHWVLSEFLGRASSPTLRSAAIADARRILASPMADVIPASAEAWTEAFEFYQARADKAWSLVDCTSILICRARSIRHVFTHDNHFVQAGFEILLP